MRRFFFFAGLLLASTVLLAQSYGKLKPIEEDKGLLVYGYEHSQGAAITGGYQTEIAEKYLKKEVLAASLNFTIGNRTPAGHGQVASKNFFQLLNKDDSQKISLIVSTNRYNNQRKIIFENLEKDYEIPLNFPVATELSLNIFLNLRKNIFKFIITQNRIRIFDSDWQQTSPLKPEKFRFIVQTSTNNGLLNSFADIKFASFNENELNEHISQINLTGIPECSTLPRHYKHVNTSMYNSSIGDLIGSNNTDRIALNNPVEAEKRVKMLAELGFTSALYSGRHFRMNYVEEFPLIREAAKVLLDYSRQYNIEIIEHHEPTIMSYRGYPLMMDKIDWLQTDIRSGESNFWFCPVNHDFKQAFLDYMARYHEVAKASGYMIDEIARANRNACYCPSCRDSYYKKSGEEAPRWTNHTQPSSKQKAYLQNSNEEISAFKCDTLAMLQDIKPDSFIMTYCSDYADPNAQMEDLTLHTAQFSSYMGWENMIYDPLNSWTSMMRCLKQRNSYGDFYNVPVWTLNREQVVRESHYLAWTMSQATRHGIWYGSRLPLDTEENKAYFLRYNKWQDVMPHQYARTLCNSAFLLSAQTKKATTDRNYYWYDSCGVLDTLIRENQQFDTILDGDLFYDGRLAKYKNIWLISQAALSDKQCENLAAWVAAGGTAVVSRNTSLFDEAGNRRHDFKLAEQMNVSSNNKKVGAVTVKSAVDFLPDAFKLSDVDDVSLLVGGKSKVLAYGINSEGSEVPLVVETSHGKGRFIYAATALGSSIYEMEMRNGRTYNYQANPPLQSFIKELFKYSIKQEIVEIDAPEKVIAIANQLQDDSADIYIQLMNFSGQTIQRGEKRFYGTPEKMLFPEIKENITVSINRPCSDTAILSTPERSERKTIKGIKQGASTVFTVPGADLQVFLQMKIAAEKYPEQAIIEPPIINAAAGNKFVKSAKEITVDEYYLPYKKPERITPSNAKDALVKIDGVTVIHSDRIEATLTEISPLMVKSELPECVDSYYSFENAELNGELAGGKALDGDFPFVREITQHENGKIEINLAGVLQPKIYPFKHFGYSIRIPVETLVGAKASYTIGMHRRMPEPKPRERVLTGKEPENEMIFGHVRQVQFTGGKVDFMLDFANQGIWGIFIETLSSQYKAHLRREGEYYIFYFVQNTGVGFGAKNASKVVIHPGIHHHEDYHPMNNISYQINRPASIRMQFSDEEAVEGFKIRNTAGFNKEFEAVNPGNWSNLRNVRLQKNAADKASDPLFASAIAGNGKNTLTFEHHNGIALVNIGLKALQEDIKGTVNTGGKEYSFELNKGERDTLIIPTWIKDGEIKVNFNGNWAVAAIVVQPLMSEEEDYIFKRSWWACGIAPYLLPEMKQNAQDWRLWKDQPYQQAKWNW